MKYHISVTADDIVHGQYNSAHYCPIARAATRAILGKEIHEDSIFDHQRVSVAGEIRVYRGEFGELFGQADLPQEARDFIQKFDAGGRLDVRPFEFDLELR